MCKRVAVTAAAAAFAAAFIGPPSASAAVGDAGVCVFDGLSGQLNPPIQDVLSDAGLTDVERGSYNFHSSGATLSVLPHAVCAGRFGGDVDVAEVEIRSDGYFDNILCGTGFAHDLDGAQTTVVGTGVLGTSINISGAGYEIPFVAGVGPLLIGPGPSLAGLVTPGTHAGAAVPDGTHGAKTSDWVGTGIVEITPDFFGSGDNCVASPDGDTDQFEVHGFFAVAGIG